MSTTRQLFMFACAMREVLRGKKVLWVTPQATWVIKAEKREERRCRPTEVLCEWYDEATGDFEGMRKYMEETL